MNVICGWVVLPWDVAWLFKRPAASGGLDWYCTCPCTLAGCGFFLAAIVQYNHCILGRLFTKAMKAPISSQASAGTGGLDSCLSAMVHGLALRLIRIASLAIA